TSAQAQLAPPLLDSDAELRFTCGLAAVRVADRHGEAELGIRIEQRGRELGLGGGRGGERRIRASGLLPFECERVALGVGGGGGVQYDGVGGRDLAIGRNRDNDIG